MNKHIYYRLRFRLISPMCVSSGASVNTDRDVLRGANGEPFIPAATIVGVMRSLLPKADGDRLFGSAADEGTQSPVIAYDAHPDEAGCRVIERDSVCLDRYRVAVDGMKFDAEFVEAGSRFIGYLETDARVPQEITSLLEHTLALLAGRECGFGSKTARGFGRAKLTVEKRSFDFAAEDEKKAWLDFDLFDPQAFDAAEQLELADAIAENTLRVLLNFALKGGLSIREYRTEAADEGELAMPDYVPLAANGNPVIPGTSWAGAFRHRFESLMADKALEDELFGTTEHSSRVRFSETQITGDHTKLIYTRNAVDRFSGKVKDGALYTEEVCYGGSGTLVIEVSRSVSAAVRTGLGACIADLIHGYLAVGGLGSVGRGVISANALYVDHEQIDINAAGWEGVLINALAK